MNTINKLETIDLEKHTDRITKGYELYNSGLVERINLREYIVSGKYTVEDLTTNEDIEPYLKCSCPDHVYRAVQCKHIIAVTFSMMGYGA